MEETTGVRWGVERRLEFIEFRLFWEGSMNRADLIDTFGISVPQASKDLSLYQERAPANMVYDKSAKRYVAADGFSPLFLDTDPDAYLSRLRSVAERSSDFQGSWLATPPPTDVALTPKRDVERQVLRAILAAIRDEQSIEILYQSMNRVRPDPTWRRISPHALGYDGFRWHARSYCHIDSKFKDFLLPRTLEARAPGEAGTSGTEDWCWHEFFGIEIAPHPDLAPSQKAVVAKDYGLNDGKGVLRVRYAMLFYVLKRLGLMGDPEKQDSRQQHIVLVNKRDVQFALEKAQSSDFNTENPHMAAQVS